MKPNPIHPADPDSLIGREVRGYRIGSIIGKGGMGTVFKATQLSLDRPVALKFLSANRFDREVALSRFQREIEVQRRLEHSHLVRIYDVGAIEGVPFIAMELVEGETLAVRIAAAAPLPIREVLQTGSQLACALDYLASRGVVHRDLKPANVLLGPERIVKVADFGLSRHDVQTLMTQPGQMIGTLTHLAPEVVLGGRHTSQSDAYALGLILYEMIVGELPYRGRNIHHWMRTIVATEPAPIHARGIRIAHAVEQLVMGLLEKEPGSRPTLAQADAALRAEPEDRTSRRVETPSCPARTPGSTGGVMTRTGKPKRGQPETQGSPTIGSGSGARTFLAHPKSLRVIGFIGIMGIVGLSAIAWTLRLPPPAPTIDSGPSVTRPTSPGEASGDQSRTGLEIRASQGDAAAQFELAVEFEQGRWGQPDFASALPWYTRAAEGGHMLAQQKLGECYDTGEGVGRDPEKAAHWFLWSARQGNTIAQARLARMYHVGEGVKKNMNEALEWYQVAANSGSTEAATNLGTLLLLGDGTQQDLVRARQWLTRAARGGHAVALNNLGVIHEKGHGVPVDPKKAVGFYEASALQGYAEAKVNLAVMLITGQGTRVDPVRARELLEDPARRGHPLAQYNLAGLFFRGNGVEKDQQKALELYRKAADQGHALSQMAMGDIYSMGSGPDGRDLAKARYWYDRAHENGIDVGLARWSDITFQSAAESQELGASTTK